MGETMSVVAQTLRPPSKTLLLLEGGAPFTNSAPSSVPFCCSASRRKATATPLVVTARQPCGVGRLDAGLAHVPEKTRLCRLRLAVRPIAVFAMACRTRWSISSTD